MFFKERGKTRRLAANKENVLVPKGEKCADARNTGDSRLPPNSSPSSLPVSRVQRKVKELATGTARDNSG